MKQYVNSINSSNFEGIKFLNKFSRKKLTLSFGLKNLQKVKKYIIIYKNQGRIYSDPNGANGQTLQLEKKIYEKNIDTCACFNYGKHSSAYGCRH